MILDIQNNFTAHLNSKRLLAISKKSNGFHGNIARSYLDHPKLHL